MYQLRNYQLEAVDKGVHFLTKQNPKPFVVVMATGAGKSLVIAEMNHRIKAPILVLQPSRELVLQNYEKMMGYNPDFEVGVYCGGLKRKEIRHITYATIQSVYKKPEEFSHFKYVVIDECHQVDPQNLEGMYASFLKAIGCNRVCGLTATPYRLQQRFYWDQGVKYYTAQLAMINRLYPFFFKSIVYKIETDELIDQGYLSPILYRQVNIGNYDEIKMNKTRTEYDMESLSGYWENDMRLRKLAGIIQKVDEKCQRSLIFCSSLLQASRAREMLSEMGIRAEMVDGSTSDKDRTRLVAAYRSGEFKHLLNVGVFTTGFDVPEMDCIILTRPTLSLALYYQMVGRGVRLDPARPNKKLRVYDLVQLTQKLGRVETIKVQKEIVDGKQSYLDEVVSEAGKMSQVPLFTFAMKPKEPS